MKSTYDDIRTEFADEPYTIEDLDNFIKAKEKYLQTKDINDRVDLKMKYVNIYEDIKGAYYCHRYSEEIFLSFKKCLQEM